MSNTTKTDKSPLFRVADHEQTPQAEFSHPLNPESAIRGISLSDATGLQRVGVHLIRIAPGKESFVYHKHHGEEEFIYILSGRAIAEIGDDSVEVGPGDFMGFPTPSVAHHLRNPFDEELVYLSGGERKSMEIADFPRLGKRLLRVGSKVSITSTEGDEPFPGFEPVA